MKAVENYFRHKVNYLAIVYSVVIVTAVWIKGV